VFVWQVAGLNRTSFEWSIFKENPPIWFGFGRWCVEVEKH